MTLEVGTNSVTNGLPMYFCILTWTVLTSCTGHTVSDRMDKFFERLAEDLETYAGHAKRKTIEVEDAELLLKR